MSNESELSRRLTAFEGVFCSGFFIPNQAIVTALALIFEKVHFLNQLEYVIELSKTLRLKVPGIEDVLDEISLTPVDPENKDDPLASLNSAQRRTVLAYLYLSDRFFMRNALLFPDVFQCPLLPNGEVLSAKLIKQGRPGELNTYEVTRNSLVVAAGARDELQKLLSGGRIAVVGGIMPEHIRKVRFAATQVATALAIKSIAMVLPGTKAVKAGEILDARERLRDHLPPFWSSMLKLSVDLSSRLRETSTEAELQRDVEDAVSTTVRPALIELVNKVEKERKQWFHRILSPVMNGLRILAGRPPTDLAGLLSASFAMGANVAVDFATQLRKVETLKQESGLTYVIELHRLVEKSQKAK
ncbi:MAG: hypothetical protein ABSH52_31585 [Terriglobia bacterium]